MLVARCIYSFVFLFLLHIAAMCRFNLPTSSHLYTCLLHSNDFWFMHVVSKNLVYGKAINAYINNRDDAMILVGDHVLQQTKESYEL